MKFLQSFFARDTFEEVNNARIHAIVNPAVLKVLGPQGFVEAGDLKWVRDRDAPIRHLFAFMKWKGGVLAPRWGVSLDFVPHVSGQQVRWHRSNASAMCDLCVDARDKALDMTYLSGEKPIRQRHSGVLAAAIPRANDFWERCKTIDDLWGAIAWLKTYLSGDGLGFDNYTQHKLTVAFLLARADRHDDAVTVLKQHMSDLVPVRAQAKLLKMASGI